MEKRRLAAILAADIAGYSALMSADEAHTVQDLKGHQSIVLPMVASYGGRVVDTAGDGILADFGSVLNAVTCAIDIQKVMDLRNSDVEAPRRMRFRIGINLGDVIYDDVRIYGEGVNIAARLESIAEPGGICLSGKVHDEIYTKMDLTFEDLGRQELKNIPHPVQVYRVTGLGQRADPPLAQLVPGWPGVAILPFNNMTNDPDQDYFADGVVEDITTALSHCSGLFVIARNSSFTYKGKAVDIKRVGQELGVQYVLEGSVRKAGQRVRVTAQLIQTDTGAHVWADKYDRGIADIFAVQDEITESIVGTLAPSIRDAEIAKVQRKIGKNLKAHELNWKALPLHYSFTREGNLEAVRLNREAIAIDPLSGPGHNQLAHTLWSQLYNGWSTDPSLYSEVMSLSERAAQLDPKNPDIMINRAAMLQYCTGDHDRAVAIADEAVSANPCSALVCRLGSVVYLSAGLPERSLSLSERAIRLHPRGESFLQFSFMSSALILLKRDAEAASAARRAIHGNPNFNLSWQNLVAALGHLGQTEEATIAVAELLLRIPTYSCRSARRDYKRRNIESSWSRILEGYRLAGLPE